MADMLKAALAHASRGLPVFPCVVNGKEPRTAHGLKDASTDPTVITRWWSSQPRANIAVATGAPGPDVLDVDTKDGRAGMELFDRARRAGLLRGAHAVVKTPSGGLHVWFAGTSQPCGAVGGKNKPLELKATGGYVLLPPSYVIDDRYGYEGRYELQEWREEAGTVDFAAIRRLLEPPRPAARRSPRPASSDFGALVRWLEVRPAGNRNRPLFWACCRALEAGASASVLDEMREAIVRAGHDPQAAERTVESAKNRFGGASA